MRTAKSCGPDPPTLGSSPPVMPGRRWRLSSPVLQGEREAAVKTIAQGVPDRFGFTCLSCGHLFFSAHEPAGAASARHSLRPLPSRGRVARKTRTLLRAARMRGRVFCCLTNGSHATLVDPSPASPAAHLRAGASVGKVAGRRPAGWGSSWQTPMLAHFANA
jgi:hypothetical protein